MFVVLKKDNFYSFGFFYIFEECLDVCRIQQRFFVVICVVAEYFVLEVLIDWRFCGVFVSNRYIYKLIQLSYRDICYNKDRYNKLILLC